MKPKDLLSKLTSLEGILDDFSFEELNATEASQLKKSFESFKGTLVKNVLKNTVYSANGTDSGFEKFPNKKKNAISSEESMLIANVSHEMRTPLNGIIGFTDLLKEDDLTERQQEQVNAIESASNALMEIINQLLEYSKLSAGLEKFESIDFNIYSLIKDVMYLCNTLITNKEVKLEANIDPDVPKILIGDPSKLSQVLLNLLGNAIKFVEEGQIHLEVVKIQQNGDSFLLEFRIVDTGIGIAEEYLEHIFDSFKQAGGAPLNNHGYGLGLSIVKQIIENSGGNIKVFSSLGIGTTFKFNLPYKIGNEQNSIKKSQVPKENLKGQEIIQGLHILVFEDNTLNQRLIEQRLKVWKCKTYITDNAHYGLNILKKNKIDLVLMDLRMPGMNGFEVTERIRNSENAYIRQIPIIALSADYTMQDQEKCDAFGINDFILKPYGADELLSKLIKNSNVSERSSIPENRMTSNVRPADQNTKIDLSCLLEECGGNIGQLEELVRLYKQNAREFMQNTKLCLKNADLEKLGFATHKIKSGLALMKTKDLHDIVVQMHQLCQTPDNMDQLQSLLNCFRAEYLITEKSIDVAIDNIRKERGNT